MEAWPTSTSLWSMEQGRLGTSEPAQKPGSSDPVLSAQCGRGQVDAEELADEELTAGASGRAARRSGSSDPVPSAARARVDDSEVEEQRAAGGPGPRRSRHHRMDVERSLIG